MRKAIEGGDTDAIKKASDELQEKFGAISAELYKQASAAAGATPSGEPGAGGEHPESEEKPKEKKADGKVVDADFEVVDKDKK